MCVYPCVVIVWIYVSNRANMYSTKAKEDT